MDRTQLIKAVLVFLFWGVLVVQKTFADESELRIGFITDTTGPGAFFGVASKAGIALAEKELIADGNPVKVLWGEHAGKPQQAITEVKSLLQLHKPDGLIVEFSSGVNSTVEIVKQEGKPFFGNCGSAGFVERDPYAFKSSIEFDSGCKALYEKFSLLEKKRILILAANGDFGERCIDGVHSINGQVETVRFNLGQDVRSEVTKIIHDGYDAIILAGLEDDAVLLFKTLGVQQAKITVGVTQTVFASKSVQNEIQNLKSEIYTFALKSIPLEFMNKLSSKVQEANIGAAVYGYVSLKQMVSALRACSKGELSCFRDQILKSPPQPEFSFLKFDPNRIARWEIEVKRYEPER